MKPPTSLAYKLSSILYSSTSSSSSSPTKLHQLSSRKSPPATHNNLFSTPPPTAIMQFTKSTLAALTAFLGPTALALPNNGNGALKNGKSPSHPMSNPPSDNPSHTQTASSTPSTSTTGPKPV